MKNNYLYKEKAGGGNTSTKRNKLIPKICNQFKRRNGAGVDCSCLHLPVGSLRMQRCTTDQKLVRAWARGEL